MSADFASIFSALRPILDKYQDRLSVSADTATEFTVLTQSPSPFPQHKGQPLYFGSVRVGKAYVSFHLMPIYMCPELVSMIPASLKKRMQGKSCFNFKTIPDATLLRNLEQLTQAGVDAWREKQWL